MVIRSQGNRHSNWPCSDLEYVLDALAEFEPKHTPQGKLADYFGHGGNDMPWHPAYDAGLGDSHPSSIFASVSL